MKVFIQMVIYIITQIQMFLYLKKSNQHKFKMRVEIQDLLVMFLLRMDQVVGIGVFPLLDHHYKYSLMKQIPQLYIIFLLLREVVMVQKI